MHIALPLHKWGSCVFDPVLKGATIDYWFNDLPGVRESDKIMFTHILVPLDGSLVAECVLPHIVAFAQISNAHITLLHVLEGEPTRGSLKVVDPLDWVIRKAEVEVYLQSLQERFREVGLETSTDIIEGRAADGILTYASEHKADLIALSSHGSSGLSSWNISSVVQKVLNRAQTSLLLIPAYRQTHTDRTDFHYQRVLVGLDGSRRAEWVIPEALNIISFHHASLLLAHVVPRLEIPPYMTLYQDESDLLNRINDRSLHHAEIYLNDLCSLLPTNLYDIRTALVLSENQIDALRELAEQENVDLVILNAHGSSGGFKRQYGSVTLSFINYGTHPMLILQDLHPGILQPTQAEIATIVEPKH
jgi:nucleotide-binding universal stress UspA family protein